MNKKLTCGILAAAMAFPCVPLRGSCIAEGSTVIGIYEAESGRLQGRTKIEKGTYVTGFQGEGDLCEIPVQISDDGFYDLDFQIKSLGGHKENYVLVDGKRVGYIACDFKEFTTATVRRIFLRNGNHTISVSSYWGYIGWDSLTIRQSEPFDESVFEIEPTLINPNADINARRLFSYLCDQYGKTIISGQYCDSGMNGWENLRISENNGGKFPAILGLDMAYYSQTGVDHQASVKTTEQALACWKKGGIITLCWHWLAPEKYVTGTWYGSFRSGEVKMNLTKIMNGKDPEGLALIKKDIGNIAAQLKIMQDAGVPVLWRPLHEASGGWFWWGAEGADTYKKLYILLYETLTNEYGLNNLIWLWNGQSKEWYPGDEYVDIVGMDIYAGEHEYASQSEAFLTTLESADSKKMVVLSENGTMIDPDLSVRDRAMWGFFCTWSGDFVIQDGLKKKYSEQYTEIDMLTKVYNSEYVITRDELPDLKNYPLRGETP